MRGFYASFCPFLRRVDSFSSLQALDKASLLLTTTKCSAIEKRKFRPSIRIAVSAGHEEKDLVNAVAQLKKVAAAVFKK